MADLAVFVVSAVEGVEAQTEMVWRRAEELGVPRMVFINKLDRERADFERTLDQLRDSFGAGVAPARAAPRRRGRLHAASPTCSPTRRSSTTNDGTHAEAEIPDDLADLEHQVHDNLVEGIVVADDELMERYLEGDVPSVEELEHTLALGVADAHACSRSCAARPPPASPSTAWPTSSARSAPRRPTRPVTVARRRHRDRGRPRRRRRSRSAFVFKTIADPYVGQLSLFKVLSGTVKADDHLVNPRTGADERLHGLFYLRGKEQEPTSAVVAGDIAAVAKLADTGTGDTLAPKNMPVRVPAVEAPPPVLVDRGQGPHPGRRRQARRGPPPPPGRGPGPRSSSATTRPARPC